MKKGDKLVIIREENVDPVLSHQTRMIAALIAIGIRPDAQCGYQETRETIDGKVHSIVTWTLPESSECEEFDTQKMVAAWHNPKFVVENPDHPFAYIKAAFGHHVSLVDQLGEIAPLAVIRKNGRTALIPLDATPERRKELMDALIS